MNNRINANTKIAAILKQNPESLEAIISISPKFNKLRNPLLRKIMASRTSISMASKVAGCSIEEFYARLEPLGFVIDRITAPQKEEEQMNTSAPPFLKDASAKNIIELDVRPVIESGKDPFNLIFEKIKQLQEKDILKLVNSFEPVPLITLLRKQGYEVYIERINDNLINTYFFRETPQPEKEPVTNKDSGDWDAILRRFEGALKTIDVREMQMPMPMMTILQELDQLPAGSALYVYHKRIPVYLLPELADRKFEYRIKEISDAEVHMLIFRP